MSDAYDAFCFPPIHARPLPYTHEVHAAAMRVAALAGRAFKPFVQFSYAGLGNCARIDSAWLGRNGEQMWSLVLAGPSVAGRCATRADRVTACQGVDGHCVCAGERDGFPDSGFQGVSK